MNSDLNKAEYKEKDTTSNPDLGSSASYEQKQNPPHAGTQDYGNSLSSSSPTAINPNDTPQNGNMNPNMVHGQYSNPQENYLQNPYYYSMPSQNFPKYLGMTKGVWSILMFPLSWVLPSLLVLVMPFVSLILSWLILSAGVTLGAVAGFSEKETAGKIGFWINLVATILSIVSFLFLLLLVIVADFSYVSTWAS